MMLRHSIVPHSLGAAGQDLRWSWLKINPKNKNAFFIFSSSLQEFSRDFPRWENLTVKTGGVFVESQYGNSLRFPPEILVQVQLAAD